MPALLLGRRAYLRYTCSFRRTPSLNWENGVLRLESRDEVQGAILRRWFEDVVLKVFAGRILSADGDVARCCAALNVPKTRPERDAWIAATALVHGMTVVTRNVADFQPMGVTVLNPWEYQT